MEPGETALWRSTVCIGAQQTGHFFIGTIIPLTGKGNIYKGISFCIRLLQCPTSWRFIFSQSQDSQHCHWYCRCQHRHPHRDHIAKCTSSPTKDRMTARTNPVTRFFAFKPSLRIRSKHMVIEFDRSWHFITFDMLSILRFFLLLIWKPWGSQSWSPETGEHPQVHQDD